MHRFIFLTLAAISCGNHQAQGRLLESWPYDRLMKEADVVVIGTAVSSQETGEIWKASPWKKVDFLGVNTVFSVEAILKGKVSEGKLTVLHYRVEPGKKIVNGPLLVSFRTRDISYRTKTGRGTLEKPSYLLFLKKRKDGRYEAVSGQVDPALAVREMYYRLPKWLEQPEKD